MDLTRMLLRTAAIRPPVLLATMPGGTGVRLVAERELRLMGWPVAATPAEAHLLMVAGPLVPGVAQPLEEAGQAMPSPRARTHATGPDEVIPALWRGRRHLADVDAQRADAAVRVAARHETESQPPGEEHHVERDAHDGSAGGTNHASDHHQHDRANNGQHGGQRESVEDGAQREHADHGERSDGNSPERHGEPGAHHGGHEGHGMHDMGMQMPAGLRMAERGEDRDGLRLDQLHVALGPILADWPAGLVLRVTLQGDVIQLAQIETVFGDGSTDGSWWTQPWRWASAGEAVPRGEVVRRRAAAHLDSLGRFLAVAGWADAATTARRLRDELLAGTRPELLRVQVAAFARRVDRSWTLRWLTRRLGTLTTAGATAAGVGGPALRTDGDVTARYRQWLAEIVDGVGRLDDPAPLDPTREEGPRGRLNTETSPSAALLNVLPGLLEGAEFANARLIVASLDPDLDELATRRQEAGNG